MSEFCSKIYSSLPPIHGRRYQTIIRNTSWINIVNQIPLHFEFKGGRTYVHGTDMYNQIITQLCLQHSESSLSSLSLTIHQRTSSQGILLIGDADEVVQRPEHGVAEMYAATPLGAIYCWLTETDEPVVGRYPYAEDEIAALCRIEDDQITVQSAADYTPIEIVVAMNKALHLHVIGEADRKWLFTRLQLARPFQPKDTASFKIVLTSRFASDRLTQSAIFANEQLLGHIYFSAVKT